MMVCVIIIPKINFKDVLMKKLLCIDGNSILNRQFYGIRYLANKEGFPTNAIFGMINVIAKQLENLSPDYTAIAFDLKAPTFRHEMFADYKAGRKPMPDDLRAQMPVAKEICRALGFSVIEKEGYEADDILGTLSKMAEREDVEAYVLTGDRDSLQLISDKVKVLLATNTDTVVFDSAAFFEKYGVRADQFVDVKALMGDSSDNIPGVPGIGEKSAFKLIGENGSLDSLYEKIDEITLTPSVRRKLCEGRDLAFLSQKLATINCDSPIGYSLSDIENKGIDSDCARELFLKYELFGAIKRFGLDKVEAEEKICECGKNASEIISVDISRLASMSGEFFGFDTVDGICLASDGECVYKIESSADEIESFLLSHKIICYDAKSIYKSLEKIGIHYRGAYFDVMLGAYVDDSAQSGYTVQRLVSSYLGEVFDENVNSSLYAMKMWREIEKRLNESGQLSLLYDIEMPLSAVLCDMELAGFFVNCEGIEKYGHELDAIAADLEARIYLAAGREFNINSPKQLGEVLFEELMLPAGKKTKTGYSTSAEILEKLRKYHPIIDDILDYRQVTKLKSTYVDGLLKVVGEDGKIHTHLKQTGTATGRLSSTEPNLQNIPIRTELGREFRKFFIPENENKLLIDADYSQIELRVLAHISGDENMIDAFVGGYDIHTSTACRIFGITPEAMTVEHRKRAKAINFGILYGMGEFSLSDDLKISIAKAKEYIKSYLDSYPAIEKYLDDIVSSAKENGFVTTMLGRRRYIPELSATNKNIRNFGERVAKNSPIQGSSADIIKLAMINVDKRLKESGTGARLLLQVHDELIVETPKECAESVLEILRYEMENAVKLSIPLTVEANIGKTWYECH